MRPARTEGIKRLVDEALANVPKPYSEDVIDEVFGVIAGDPIYRQRYDDLCTELGKAVVNAWGGYWIALAVGRVGHHQVRASNGLTETYSKLYP